MFWLAEDIDYEGDLVPLSNMPVSIQHAVAAVANFFVNGDQFVLDQIEERIKQLLPKDIAITSVYDYIKMIEGVHLRSYALYDEKAVPEPMRSQILNKTYTKTTPLLKMCQEYYNKYKDDLSMLLVMQIILEGILFGGAWLFVQWIKENHNTLRAFWKANQKIADDEGTHVDWSIMLIKHWQMEPNMFEVLDLVEKFTDEAIRIYCTDVLPEEFPTLTHKMFETHLKYLADRQLNLLGFIPLYNVTKTVPLMNNLGIAFRNSDFFTTTNLNYNFGVSDNGSREYTEIVKTRKDISDLVDSSHSCSVGDSSH